MFSRVMAIAVGIACLFWWRAGQEHDNIVLQTAGFIAVIVGVVAGLLLDALFGKKGS